MYDRIELEKKLKKSNLYLKEHMSRETVALNKIQEVLEIAEAAINEKNKALQREKETKGEILNHKGHLTNLYFIF